MGFARSGWLRLGAAIALLALVACSDEPAQPDFTQRFPIGARPETVSMTSRYGVAADPSAVGSAAAFETLVAGYLDRGHGPLTISVAASGQGDSRAHARGAAVRQRLVVAGVPASLIRIELAAKAAPGTVRLSYTRYDLVLPTCDDWSVPMQFNPSNTDYPAFGCAVQRNLGLMLADPADAVGMHPPQAPDAQTIDRVVKAYRSGAVTEAKQGMTQDTADQNVATGATPGAGSATAMPTSTH